MTDTQAKVLLVDDDKFLVEMYGAKFTAAGFSVQVCLSAKEALEAVKTGYTPDVILFDITMPEMDGLAMIQKMSQEHLADKALKVALTNQNSDAERSKAAEFGAEQYIVKASVIPSEVVAKVTEALKTVHKG